MLQLEIDNNFSSITFSKGFTNLLPPTSTFVLQHASILSACPGLQFPDLLESSPAQGRKGLIQARNAGKFREGAGIGVQLGEPIHRSGSPRHG